jgi:hypothetical protein
VKDRLTALVTVVAFAAITVTAAATPVEAAVVSLRVESSTAPAPLFDGTIETQPHEVDGGDGSGGHPCQGSPGATPTSTATGALDDAMREAAISWRGNWDPSFRDFFIDRIGPYASAPPDRYWSLTVNGRFSSGGCLTRVADGDAVRFFYGPLFGAPPGPEGETDDTASTPKGAVAPGKGAVGPSGTGSSTKRPRSVAAAASRYLRRSHGSREAWARLALSLRRGKGAAAAADLLGDRLSRQQRDGSFDGDVNATAIAVLALEARQPQRAVKAAIWLAGTQDSSGGFGYRPGVSADVDTTGMATWALALTGSKPAALRGASFIRSAQSADGGFPAIPGGESNSQSTGLAMVGLRVAGVVPRRTTSVSGLSPVDYLASLSRRDGSIAYDRHSSPTPVWSTAQALLGLTARSKLLNLDSDGGFG